MGSHLQLEYVLLSKGADVEATFLPSGQTALHLASYAGHDAIVELLLEHGAEVDAEDKEGKIPLFEAFQHKRISTMKLLLSKEPHLQLDNIRFYGGKTPLHVAIEQGNEDMLRLFLRDGAYINDKDNYGHTPLILAADQGQVSSAKILLSSGARTSLTCDGGMTALHLAAGHGHDAIVELLLAHGADVDVRDEDGRTPLISASAQGRITAVKLLLENQSNVEEEDFFGKTALDVAQERGHTEVVSMLQQW